jgi:cyanophycinase
VARQALLAAIGEQFAAGTVSPALRGAAAASDPMLYDGDGAGHRKGKVHLAPGFGFLPGITVDTHFVARGRIPRLAQALAAGSANRGIGLAEDTAIMVSPSGNFEVLGSGVVTVLESDRSLSDYGDLPDEGLVTVDGLRLGFLAPGSVFNLRSWRISQLPQSRRPRSPST